MGGCYGDFPPETGIQPEKVDYITTLDYLPSEIFNGESQLPQLPQFLPPCQYSRDVLKIELLTKIFYYFIQSYRFMFKNIDG